MRAFCGSVTRMKPTRCILFASSLALLFLALLRFFPGKWAEPSPPPVVPLGPTGGTGPVADAADPLTRSAALPVGYTARVGTRMCFELSLGSEVTLHGGSAGDGAPTDGAIAVQIDGALEITVLDRSAGSIVARYALPAARIRAGGDAPKTVAWVDGLRTALRAGFDVRLDANGRPRAVRCDAAWRSDQRQIARSLVSALGVDVRDAAEWTAVVDDAMGRHTFRCRRTADAGDALLHRERTAFAPRHHAGRHDADVELAGMATARFDAAVGWLTGLAFDETLRWAWLGDDMRIGAHLHGTLQWRRSEAVTLPAIDAGSFEELGGAEAPAVVADPLRSHWRERLAGRDAAALLAELCQLIAESEEPSQRRHELVLLLAELARGDAAQADLLAAAIQSARVTGRAAADVLSALGSAGTERAQAALCAVFENGQLAGALRQAAVESMFQIERATPALVDTLRRALHAGDPFDALSGSAMLVLGALAGRGAEGNGQPVVMELLALESAVRRQGVEPGWFEALGNTGDPAVLPLASRLCASADPVERAWGLTALRRVDAPMAHALQRAAAREDGAAGVRRQAIEQIGAIAAAWVTDALIECTDADVDADVRRAAYGALILRAPGDERARAALWRRLTVESDAGLVDLLRAWSGNA